MRSGSRGTRRGGRGRAGSRACRCRGGRTAASCRGGAGGAMYESAVRALGRVRRRGAREEALRADALLLVLLLSLSPPLEALVLVSLPRSCSSTLLVALPLSRPLPLAVPPPSSRQRRSFPSTTLLLALLPLARSSVVLEEPNTYKESQLQAGGASVLARSLGPRRPPQGFKRSEPPLSRSSLAPLSLLRSLARLARGAPTPRERE